MDDAELQQIREARMRELKNQGGGPPEPAAQKKNEEMLASVLAQLLDQPARERLNRVRIVRPERATQVEQILVNMAQTGQLAGRVDEPTLKTLLDRLAQQDTTSQRLVFRRTDGGLIGQETEQPKAAPADDDDDDFFD